MTAQEGLQNKVGIYALLLYEMQCLKDISIFVSGAKTGRATGLVVSSLPYGE